MDHLSSKGVLMRCLGGASRCYVQYGETVGWGASGHGRDEAAGVEDARIWALGAACCCAGLCNDVGE